MLVIISVQSDTFLIWSHAVVVLFLSVLRYYHLRLSTFCTIGGLLMVRDLEASMVYHDVPVMLSLWGLSATTTFMTSFRLRRTSRGWVISFLFLLIIVLYTSVLEAFLPTQWCVKERKLRILLLSSLDVSSPLKATVVLTAVHPTIKWLMCGHTGTEVC